MLKIITRKSMLYKTNVEYGDYTMNHVQGCSHGCLYPCYAFLIAKRFGTIKTIDEWVQPKLVGNTLELLDKEIPKLHSKIKSVHLCFTTDPFMYGYPIIHEMTLQSLLKLNRAKIKCSLLTKGVLPVEITDLSKENTYGITLISLDEHYRELQEPGAASYAERIHSLFSLHQRGYKTWVSIEPYPTPNIISQDIISILNAVKFTDKIIFGRTNYNKEISVYKNHKEFYNLQAQRVIEFCKKHNIEYYIKKGTITS